MRTLLTRAAKSAVLNNTATSFMLVLELESGSDEEVEVVIPTKDEAECESCP
jgi:phosphotransferase system HPr-like phosphotransfer protein